LFLSSERALPALKDPRMSASTDHSTPAPSMTAAAKPGSHVMGTYARQDVMFVKGEGAWLTSATGERYLDFTSGIAVNALGHAHPHLIEALTRQAGLLWHTSNLYRVEGQETLSDRLCRATFADRVFFTNSGAEACEGAIKLARRYHHVNGQPNRKRIITFKGAFHGRTLATIAAGGNEKYLDGFGPDMPGFDVLPWGDHSALDAAIGPDTAAVMVEPVQGEGGLAVLPSICLRGLREICDANGLLLILDEVQSGIGRTGKLFAHEWAGVTPDIMAIAKGIGGGFPVGAFLATEEAAKGMTPGTHGSTFGGNPLAMAVGNAVLDIILAPGFLEGVQAKASYFRQQLARLKDERPDAVHEVRGMGLLSGLKLKVPAGDVMKAATAERLLTVTAGDNTLRLIPPLIIGEAELAEGLKRLERALAATVAAQH
jgi:acetylornithine/N-succinyldiaminopimelate aminotransferase